MTYAVWDGLKAPRPRVSGEHASRASNLFARVIYPRMRVESKLAMMLMAIVGHTDDEIADAALHPPPVVHKVG